MDTTLAVGILGALILLVGAAWPATRKNVPSVRSLKDRLFAVGAIIMLIYAYLGYLQGGSFFFIILEIFILVATVLMMLDTDDTLDLWVLLVSGLALIVWSLYLFEGYETILFIIGLVVLGLGYAFAMGTVRRDVALCIGSTLLALFSYMAGDRIFFILNFFFMLFSGYYLLRNLKILHKTKL